MHDNCLGSEPVRCTWTSTASPSTARSPRLTVSQSHARWTPSSSTWGGSSGSGSPTRCISTGSRCARVATGDIATSHALPPLALLLQVDEEPNECDVEGMGKRRLYGDVHSSDSHILSQKHAATGVYKDSKRCVLSVGQQVGEVLLKRPLPSPGRYGFVFFLDKFVDLDNFSWLMMYAGSITAL